MKGFLPFLRGISPKVNVIVRLVFGLTYFKAAVQHFSHISSETFLTEYLSCTGLCSVSKMYNRNKTSSQKYRQNENWRIRGRNIAMKTTEMSNWTNKWVIVTSSCVKKKKKKNSQKECWKVYSKFQPEIFLCYKRKKNIIGYSAA